MSEEEYSEQQIGFAEDTLRDIEYVKLDLFANLISCVERRFDCDKYEFIRFVATMEESLDELLYDNWLEAKKITDDGEAFPRTSYPELYKQILERKYIK